MALKKDPTRHSQLRLLFTAGNCDLTPKSGADIIPSADAQVGSTPVYVREAMTPFNKKLFWLAKQELKPAYKYVWFKDDLKDFFKRIPKSNSNFTMLHVNIRSIIKNFAKVEQIVNLTNQRIDVIILTEVGISDSLSNLFCLGGYNMHTNLRKHQKGGGIIMYVRKNHKFTIKSKATTHLECTISEIITQAGYHVNLCALYRPPGLNKKSFLTEFKTILSNCHTQDMIVLGDTNINTQSTECIRDHYLNTMYEHGFACGISDFTRIEKLKDTVTKSCIDHIFVRSRLQDVYCAALGTVLADHRLTAVTCVKTRIIQDVPTFTWRYNHKILNEKLQCIDWKPIYSMDCPIKINNYINKQFSTCYNMAKYKKQINNSKRNKEGWVNNKINNAIRKKDENLLQLKNDSTNKVLLLDYNKLRNKTNKLIENSKNKYYKRNIDNCKDDPKKMWQILNTLTGRISVSLDDVILRALKRNSVDEKIIANNFATGFSESVRDILPKCDLPILKQSEYRNPTNLSMNIKKANSSSIHKIIRGIKTNKSPGIDSIRPIDIKSIAEKISEAIACLINTSIKTGKYPVDLKTGIVRPIYKKGSKQEYGNYRPITILPIVDKIFEKYVGDQIRKFYIENNVLSDNQYGFQRNKSTSQLLSSFTDHVNKCLEAKKHVLMVFIDYSKAFDTLRHKTLIQKLDDTGVRGPLLYWCTDYLKDRTFRVKVGNTLSETTEVTDGTAQGSVLGPLHYLAYVNDLNNIIKKCTVFQFADDTCLISDHKDAKVALCNLQEDFTLLCKWSHDAGLVLNASKTKLLHVHSSHIYTSEQITLVAHNHYCLHGSLAQCTCETIEQVSQHTYLGLIIDNRFNWGPHVSNVCQKLRAIMAKMYLIKRKVPYQIRLQLYIALADSIISYGLSSYGRTFKTYIDRIYNLQISMLKRILPTKFKNKIKNNLKEIFTFTRTLSVHDKIEVVLLQEHFFAYKENIKTGVKYTRQIANENVNIIRASNFYGHRTTDYIVPSLCLPCLPVCMYDVPGSNRKVKKPKEVSTHETEQLSPWNMGRNMKKFGPLSVNQSADLRFCMEGPNIFFIYRPMFHGKVVQFYEYLDLLSACYTFLLLPVDTSYIHTGRQANSCIVAPSIDIAQN
ncbi:reverse transcriptase (RNA-dependent DNA polymerase) domain-containing protein [Phthorimaea operculella]|nr:reverse transcriptase (RNA-dependent DNA polymerase) domain-containing protein [Phthorimaea operculella]